MVPYRVLGTRLIAGAIFGCSASANAQSDLDAIEEIRALAMETLGPEQLGAGYAAMINFATNPDISTATFNIDVDNADDAKLNVTRLPIRHIFNSSQPKTWHPFVAAGLAYQKFAFGLDLGGQEHIDSKWYAYGGTLAAGAEYSLNTHFNLLGSVNTGIVRMENKADYAGPVSTSFLKPGFDGIVFNWNADAWLAGISLGADYARSFQSFDFHINGSLSHNYIDTYDSSSGLIEFNSQATTFSLHADTRHPTSLSFGGFPISLLVYYGGTSFLGPDRHTMGFAYFVEGGLGLEADIGRLETMIKRLNVGAKIMYGEDVNGWTVFAGYNF